MSKSQNVDAENSESKGITCSNFLHLGLFDNEKHLFYNVELVKDPPCPMMIIVRFPSSGMSILGVLNISMLNVRP